jgi:hypothetical protein
MSWQKLENESPGLAEIGKMRLNGRVSYLATTRANGAPRVHPVTPIVGGGRLFVFMEPTSPKGKDLVRNGRYALHCSVENNDGGEGEFYVWGNGRLITDPAIRQIAVTASTYTPADRYILFELDVTRARGTTYGENGSIHQSWSEA